MTNRERFKKLMDFEKVDRLPIVEWAEWWDKTIDRWKGDGLPQELDDPAEIRAHFGLDTYNQEWLSPFKKDYPWTGVEGEGTVATMDDYERIRSFLFPEEPFDAEKIRIWAAKQAEGEMVVWISLEGFFWVPRMILGIERHLYAFYDAPELIHRINEDLLAYNLRVLDQFSQICVPDFMTFAEDMSYNKGPMISKGLFDEFLAPYYRQIVPELRKRQILPIVDTDGNIEKLIPWFAEVDVDGFLPLERQSDVDINELRKTYPKLKLVGGYDKRVMSRTEADMRAEFERILPVMKQGGFVPGVDHQTPPGVSLSNYRIYLRLLREYCEKAAQ